jgi:hypothetical protein
LSQGIIDHQRGKTDQQHFTPLWIETIAALDDVLTQRLDDQLVFRTRMGKPSGGVGMAAEADATRHLGCVRSALYTVSPIVLRVRSRILAIDPSGFIAYNPEADGTFGVAASGGDLFIQYTPIPEPSALLAVAGLTGLLRRPRRRRSLTRPAALLARPLPSLLS